MSNKSKNVTFSKVENFESVTGKGVKGTINQETIILGNKKLLEQNPYVNC